MREGDGTIYRSSGFPPGVSRLGVTKKQRMGAQWAKALVTTSPASLGWTQDPHSFCFCFEMSSHAVFYSSRWLSVHYVAKCGLERLSGLSASMGMCNCA